MTALPLSYNGKPLVHQWTYRAANGEVLGYVGRYQQGSDKKDVVPFFKCNGSGYLAGHSEHNRPLFGLEKLAKHPKDEVAFIFEGEKCVAAAHSLRITAVTSPGGANAADNADWTPLNGIKTVCLIPDKDEPGEHYARNVVQALLALDNPPEIKILRLPEIAEGGDIIDWLQMWLDDWDGYSAVPEIAVSGLRDELKELLKTAEPVPQDWLKPASSASDWPELSVLEVPLKPVQELRRELLPTAYAPWLDDVAHRMQSPLDFAAVTALVITGSVIGAGCGIRPKQKDDWEVVPNLWGACIGRPSVVLKTPSMKEPLQMLDRLQAEAGKAFEQAKAEHEFNALANKAMLDDLKGQIAGKAKGKGRDKVVDPTDMAKLKVDYLELTANAEPEPVRRLFKTNETSVQSQTVLQAQNPRGILTFRDELTGLLVRWEREDYQDERAYFLEGWNGNGSYTDFKIGRGLTEAPNICISVLGGIQPDKLKRYLAQTFNGGNDGLMQRLQLAVWPDEPNKWELIDKYPHQEEKNRVIDILRTLADADFKQYGALQGEHDAKPYFRFDAAAQAVFNAWLSDLQLNRLPTEENPLMCEHLGKYRSLMPSLALIFHLIECADGKASGMVTEQAVTLAVQWCGYLESHARRIYGMCMAPEREAAAILAGHIKDGKLPNPFTARDVYRKHWQMLDDRAKTEAACAVLEDEDWLRKIRKKAEIGQTPLPEYWINPAALKPKTA
ncbi:DUF3987 domain-containing protein [Methylomicrobium sp. Wu6]|uniref:DUF3987 domain-containing protein n=1 Tax=Methylomicrobium sp. Wu6 TaxID=3107928 RepID=UPI002DD6AFE6|nr:DUF3987 domain-containing protein [Methylomicrobium sp. Wu6]MEC4747225.1 DUF3987 domain-containing protein [Methylomicrobium sp. Wu6]